MGIDLPWPRRCRVRLRVGQGGIRTGALGCAAPRLRLWCAQTFYDVTVESLVLASPAEGYEAMGNQPALSKQKDLQEGLKKIFGEQAEKHGDRAVKAGLAGWWSSRDDAQKVATIALVATAVFGPIGMGLLAGLLDEFDPTAPDNYRLAPPPAVAILAIRPPATWIRSREAISKLRSLQPTPQ